MMQYILFLGGGIVLALIGATVGVYTTKHYVAADDSVDELDIEGGSGFTITDKARKQDGKLKSFFGAYTGERKRQKALSKGYVRWHLVGSSFEKPKYVDPERKQGGTVPELEYDNETYVFPENASVPSQSEGVPVFVHREGESEPLDLRDSWGEAIDAGALREYLDTRVTSTSPEDSGGLLSGMGFSWDPMDVLRYGILALVVGFVALEVLS